MEALSPVDRYTLSLCAAHGASGSVARTIYCLGHWGRMALLTTEGHDRLWCRTGLRLSATAAVLVRSPLMVLNLQ
jgi:hypothetical protein